MQIRSVLIVVDNIEDITLVIISYEIYQTSLRRYKMITSVIFCLSYDLSKELFIAIKVDIISTKNALLSRILAIVPARVVITSFMT